MPLVIDKMAVREQNIFKRKSLSPEEIRIRSEKIIKNILNLKAYQKAKTVMLYLPILGEPDLRPLLDGGKSFCVPIMRRGRIEAAEYKKGGKTVLADFKTAEPQDIVRVLKNGIDAVFVPGTGFGRNKGRVGFGKGFYDAFLTDINAVKIGVCYDFQLADNIPMAPSDVYMDRVIAESEVIL